MTEITVSLQFGYRDRKCGIYDHDPAPGDRE